MQLALYGNEILVYRNPVDFRKSLTGLTALVISQLKKNPQDGIYIFYNRHQDKVKCLSWHKNGFVLIYKRIEKGKFDFKFDQNDGVLSITLEEFGWLLAGLPYNKMRDFRKN